MPIPYDNEEVIQTAGTAWAVTATHNFLSQSISESTPLTTAGLATPGVENYIEEYLDFDYHILFHTSARRHPSGTPRTWPGVSGSGAQPREIFFPILRPF